MRKKTVTIGIPAYNEEANIKKLVGSLLEQKQTNYILKKIIVISDASEDSTDKKVKSVKNNKVELLRNKERIGQALTQNVILENFNSDILVLLNADVLPKDKNLIDNIVISFEEDEKIGLVGGKVSPLPYDSYVEKVLYFSTKMKDELYESLSDSNIYLCHGRVRAFSKEFANIFRWKETYGEDAYSYLSCLSHGFKFYYNKNAEVVYRLPNNLKGHFKQSVRFINSKERMGSYFGSKLIEKIYQVPFSLEIWFFGKFFLNHPLLASSYLMIFIFSNLLSKFQPSSSSTWDISYSSKKLLKEGR